MPAADAPRQPPTPRPGMKKAAPEGGFLPWARRITSRQPRQGPGQRRRPKRQRPERGREPEPGQQPEPGRAPALPSCRRRRGQQRPPGRPAGATCSFASVLRGNGSNGYRNCGTSAEDFSRSSLRPDGKTRKAAGAIPAQPSIIEFLGRFPRDRAGLRKMPVHCVAKPRQCARATGPQFARRPAPRQWRRSTRCTTVARSSRNSVGSSPA